MSEYGEYEGLDGFEVVDDTSIGIEEELDAAAAFLAGHTGEPEHISNDELMGAMTNADLNLGRIDGVEYGVQAGLKALLSGEQVYGISKLDASVAVQRFTKEIGMDPKTFANRIKVDPSVSVSRRPEHINTMLSMLGNTAGEYLERGPGKVLPGNTLNAEKRAKAEEEMALAQQYLGDLTGLYVHENTIGSPVEASRRAALSSSISDRLLNGVFYEGSNKMLALPNETGVYGIIRTQGIYSSRQGTAEDRLSASKYDDNYVHTLDESGAKRFARTEEGWKIFRDDLTEEEKAQTLRGTPSLANSLFPKPRMKRGDAPFTEEEKAKHKRDQDYLMGQAQHKAEYIRRVFREQSPTTLDESEGRINMAGFSRPFHDQEEIQDLRNEASILGLALDPYANSSGKADATHSNRVGSEVSLRQQAFSTRSGSGTDRDGMYGHRGQSEVSDFVEEGRDLELQRELEASEKLEEGTEYGPMTAHMAYQIQSLGTTSPTQGTVEWKKQRVGKITASTHAAALLRKGGVDRVAHDLASERMGYVENPFVGNADTWEGNKGEHLAINAFLAGPGKGLHAEEAFFEYGDKVGLPGFGVSPDGRLYNSKGGSEGLLEVKYLSSGSMEGALNKYTPQMQMQMAVTGESQAHFYALDKHTGRNVHEIVQADPVMQKRLILAGQEAQEMQGGVQDIEVLQEMRERIKSKRGSNIPAEAKLSGTGQTSSFEAEEVIEEVMTTFVGPSKPFTGPPKASDLAVAMSKELDAVSSGERTITDKLTPEAIMIAKKEGREARAREFLSHNGRGESIDGSSSEDKKTDREAEREKNRAERESAKALKEFEKATKKATKTLGSLAGAVLSGNEESMDEGRLAANVGLDAQNVRGMRNVLESGGVKKSNVSAAIQAAGDFVSTLNSKGGAAELFAQLNDFKGQSDIESVRTMDLSSLHTLKGEDAQGALAYQAKMIAAQPTLEGKKEVAKMFGAHPDMAFNRSSGDEIGQAIDTSFSIDDQFDTLRGWLKVSQPVRRLKEGLGGLGDIAGLVAGGTLTALGLHQAAPGVTGAITKRLPTGAVASTAARLGLSKQLVTKPNPYLIAAGAALSLPEITEATPTLKDDMVLEALTYTPKAMFGMAKDAYLDILSAPQQLSAIPGSSIGEMTSPREAGGKSGNTVNVEVTNEISPDLIRTTTDVDGDLSIDEESGLSTGG